MSERVAAIVVTYHRQELLKQCLLALNHQERPVDGVIVWNNGASDPDDPTAAWLEEWAHEGERRTIIQAQKNSGGAGGFHHAMRRAFDEGFDWFWLMDDDCICRSDSLSALLAAAQCYPTEQRPGLLASEVDWTDGLPHSMNNPGLRFNSRGNRALSYRCAERGHLLVRQVTFVSCCIHRDALMACGLPIADYFIWQDDIEYTLRVCRRFMGIVVPASRVEHRTPALHSAADAPPHRYFFAVRNGIWTWRLTTSLEGFERRFMIIGHLLATARYLAHHCWSPSAWYWVLRGLAHGCFLRPREIVSELSRSDA